MELVVDARTERMPQLEDLVCIAPRHGHMRASGTELSSEAFALRVEDGMTQQVN